MTSGELPNLADPLYPHQYKEDNSSYLTGLLWGLNRIICVTFLAPSTCSVNTGPLPISFLPGALIPPSTVLWLQLLPSAMSPPRLCCPALEVTLGYVECSGSARGIGLSGWQYKAAPLLRLPRWFSGKESICQCRNPGFDPWVRKVSSRRKWQPTPVFWPGEFHGQRRLVGYSPLGHKLSDTSDQLIMHA